MSEPDDHRLDPWARYDRAEALSRMWPADGPHDAESVISAAEEAVEALAPPPKRRPQPRVQMNVRIDADDDRDLRDYECQHGASRQAVVDQMIPEYLQRRGLRD